MSQKNLLLIGGIVVAAGVAWYFYQRNRGAVAATTTNVTNEAPADSTAQIIGAGSSALNSITNFFQ